MPGFRAHSKVRKLLRPQIFGAAALVCLVLVLLLATVQVTHLHPSAGSADRCPLCILLHSAAPVTTAAAAAFLVSLGTHVPTRETSVAVHLQIFHLFTRPPPEFS